jgi:hypothetical protein
VFNTYLWYSCYRYSTLYLFNGRAVQRSSNTAQFNVLAMELFNALDIQSSNFSPLNLINSIVSAVSMTPLKFEYNRFPRWIRSHMRNGFRPWIKAPWWGWLMKKTEGRKSRLTVPLTALFIALDIQGCRYSTIKLFNNQSIKLLSYSQLKLFNAKLFNTIDNQPFMIYNIWKVFLLKITPTPYTGMRLAPLNSCGVG